MQEELFRGRIVSNEKVNWNRSQEDLHPSGSFLVGERGIINPNPPITDNPCNRHLHFHNSDNGSLTGRKGMKTDNPSTTAIRLTMEIRKHGQIPTQPSMLDSHVFSQPSPI